MENPFTEAISALGRPDYGRFSFDEQCAYFAALCLNCPPVAVANASGMSQSVVSLLKNAGSVRGGQLRYPKVAREYAALGHEAFVHKYLNPLIRDRLMVEIEALRQAARARHHEPLNDQGYSPRAQRYVGRHEWKETDELPRTVFAIELCPGRGGYLWRYLSPFGLPEIAYHEADSNPISQLRGDPSRGPEDGPDAKGFATSELCYRHVQRVWGRSRAK